MILPPHFLLIINLFLFNFILFQESSFIIFMSWIRKQQIINQEISLMKSKGSSLGMYAEIHQKRELFYETSEQAAKQFNLLFTQRTRSVGNEPNANIKVFIIVILKIIFEKKQKQPILQKIKQTLYSECLDLNTVNTLQRPKLDSKNIKKLLVEFFQVMNYSKDNQKVQTRLIKYPIIVDLLTIYFHCLYNFLFDKNNQSNVEIETIFIIPVFSQFFKINCSYFMGICLFPDHNYFISTHDNHEYVYGIFCHNPCIYSQPIQNQYQQQKLSNQIRNYQTTDNFNKRPKIPKISFGMCQDNCFQIEKTNLNSCQFTQKNSKAQSFQQSSVINHLFGKQIEKRSKTSRKYDNQQNLNRIMNNRSSKKRILKDKRQNQQSIAKYMNDKIYAIEPQEQLICDQKMAQYSVQTDCKIPTVQTATFQSRAQKIKNQCECLALKKSKIALNNKIIDIKFYPVGKKTNINQNLKGISQSLIFRDKSLCQQGYLNYKGPRFSQKRTADRQKPNITIFMSNNKTISNVKFINTNTRNPYLLKQDFEKHRQKNKVKSFILLKKPVGSFISMQKQF